MKKILKFAHAKFLTLEFLKNAWAKINFDTKFELSIKFRVEWYIMVWGICDLPVFHKNACFHAYAIFEDIENINNPLMTPIP